MWVQVQRRGSDTIGISQHGEVLKLTDTGLDLLVTVLKDDVWVLLADEVVVLQELTGDTADGVCLTACCHVDTLSCK